MKRLGLLLIAVMSMVCVVVSQACAAGRLLFLYPSPMLVENGKMIASPITFRIEQITTMMPDTNEISGIVMIVYWSQLCPEQDKCDYSIIDNTLKYWAARNRKVVLCVATVGHPIEYGVLGNLQINNATPKWVLDKTVTYKKDTRVIGYGGAQGVYKQEVFPYYTDQFFLQETERLVSDLAKRYDGNESLYSVRVATGVLGEDHPSSNGLRTGIPSYSDQDWIVYTNRILELYAMHFKRTQLEFDINRLSWIYVQRNAKLNSQIDALIDKMHDLKVFLSHNGLRAESLEKYRQKPVKDGHAQSLKFLKAYKNAGGEIGLEAIGPIQSEKMSDIDEVVAAVNEFNPKRVVLFGSTALLMKHKSIVDKPSQQIWQSFLSENESDGRRLEEKNNKLVRGILGQ